MDALDEAHARHAASVLKALADPNRLRIAAMLGSAGTSDVCVCDLTGPLGLSQPTVSHHMKVLRQAGIVEGATVEAWIGSQLEGQTTSSADGSFTVAVSQSGTTTDTNRTVDLVRARGASVLAIVNRRNSDLTDKADGVLYTSDGRDVEMSVASTKAFYSQVAAGSLLAHNDWKRLKSGAGVAIASAFGAVNSLINLP